MEKIDVFILNFHVVYCFLKIFRQRTNFLLKPRKLMDQRIFRTEIRALIFLILCGVSKVSDDKDFALPEFTYQ